MGKYFGTDGFRGEANIVLKPEHAYKIGRYIGWYFGREHKAKIVIGKDTRLSGYMFENALIAGMTASGCDAYKLHVTTTPSVSYIAKTDGFDCGVMISASHNPYYDNGIKLISGDGRKISADVEACIEEFIDGKLAELPFASKDSIGKCIDYCIGREKYIEHLVNIPKVQFDGIKVALDCSNGSSFEIANNVYKRLGIVPYVISNTPDGTNINKDCGSTHPEKLQKYVKENDFDLGFAFDGDADRCLAVDHDGRLIDGDRIMFICGKYLKEQGRLKKDTVVTTIMSNLGMYRSLEKEHMRSEKTDVGDKYVAENMFANGYSLGGEQSGHIIFGDYASTGDGILTSLMVLETVAVKKKSLKELADECDIYPQVLINVAVKDKNETMASSEIRKAVEDAKEALGDTGRILVRASGTETKVRVMVEAPSNEICEKYAKEVSDVIRNKFGASYGGN